MPTLLFFSPTDSPKQWQASLQRLMPELEVRVWPAVGRHQDIEYALVWRPPPDVLGHLPNLKVIFSLGAGVDHLLASAALPGGLPFVRMIDPALTEGMSEYVLYHVLHYHRHMSEYASQQRERVWRELPQVRAADRRVGIMGLGVIGGDVASKLTTLGFAVRAWCRSDRSITHVKIYHGYDQLISFLRDTQILVCLLPLTPDTEGILNRERFSALPSGACMINVGRGRHLVEEDLLDALDNNHLAGATLDVFRTEPLPTADPFWKHPKVTVTPHIASLTNPTTAAAHVIENIRRSQRGEPLVGVVDRKRGY
jgi:glyoxylate/hydroxypyruvate reductase A